MNPYRDLPPESFWKNFKKTNFDLNFFIDKNLVNVVNPKFIASAGSCFEANVAIHLKNTSAKYIYEEQKHPFLSSVENKYNYDSYSARYGNVYSSKQLLQLVRRAKGKFSPSEIMWKSGDGVKDPFRPGLNFDGFTEAEYLLDIELHLKAVERVISNCDTFIFTLGLSEVWVNRVDESAYPSCPGVIAGVFDPEKYELINLDVDEIINDLNLVNDELKELNPKINFVLTVSPVPMVATANATNIVLSNQYSKSKLIVAAHGVVAKNSNMHYFPSYEMIIGSHAKDNFLDDKRNVKPEVVTEVMEVFKNQFNINNLDIISNDDKDLISKYLDGECEEMAYDNQ